jgi:hypothetical protein
MKQPTIYVRKKTQWMLIGCKMKALLTLEVKEGSRGRWNIAGDESGVYDFATDEERDAEIAKLVATGAVLR